MPPLRNRATVPQGMLAPSGFVEGFVNPAVQSTARPAGTLLRPSPGYDTVRIGKNRFQGRGPSGGFRPSEFAEDVGRSGAVLSVIPGDTTAIEASEWLPESADSLPEGSVIISDRKHMPGFAGVLHEAYSTVADMGDRTAERPRTRATWFANPIGIVRKDYREHPAATVLASVGLLLLVNVVLRDVERSWRTYRPSGVGTAATAAPATAASAGGDVAKDVSDAASQAVNKIGEATDKAVNRIGEAADSAVSTVKNAGS